MDHSTTHHTPAHQLYPPEHYGSRGTYPFTATPSPYLMGQATDYYNPNIHPHLHRGLHLGKIKDKLKGKIQQTIETRMMPPAIQTPPQERLTQNSQPQSPPQQTQSRQQQQQTRAHTQQQAPTDDYGHALSPNFSAAVSPANHHATLVAAMPQDRSERRRVASSLIEDIDTYEHLQNRVSNIQSLPAPRFKVTVVRRVNGQPQHVERVMSMRELRTMLESSIRHNEEHLTYEDLVNLQRVQHGIEDTSIYPTFEYHTDHMLPENKSTCSICLSNFEDGELLKTIPCMHFYHSECIDHWLHISKLCPVCKYDMDDGKVEVADAKRNCADCELDEGTASQ